MAAEFDVIFEDYDRAAQPEYVGGVSAVSFEGADQFWKGLQASFPNAEFKVHQVIERDKLDMPPRAGRCTELTMDNGTFGETTGTDVFVLGATHAEYGELVGGAPKLRREWTLYDETIIWKQILLPIPGRCGSRGG